jgi:hypothetical protein
VSLDVLQIGILSADELLHLSTDKLGLDVANFLVGSNTMSVRLLMAGIFATGIEDLLQNLFALSSLLDNTISLAESERVSMTLFVLGVVALLDVS